MEFTSLQVAKRFDKKHNKVLQHIRHLECSDEFRSKHFKLSSYKDAQGKSRPMYEMTKSGLMMLVMSFGGRKAAVFKIFIINTYNEMCRTVEQYSNPVIIP